MAWTFSWSIPKNVHRQCKWAWKRGSSSEEILTGVCSSPSSPHLPCRGRGRGGACWELGWVKRAINEEISQVTHPIGERKPTTQGDKDMQPFKWPEKMRGDQGFSSTVLGCLPQKFLQCFLKMQSPGGHPRPNESESLKARLGLYFTPILRVGFRQPEVWQLSPRSKNEKRNETRREILVESGGAGTWHHLTGSV